MTLSALGIFSAAGATPPEPPFTSDYELISTQILGTSAASVTFTGLGSFSSTYRHLQIRFVAKSSATGDANGDPVRVRLNGVTTSTYFLHGLFGDGANVGSFSGTSQSSMRASRISSSFSGTNASSFGGVVMDIVDSYSSTKNKTIRAIGGHNSVNSWPELSSGLFPSTASITSIELFGESGNLLTGSRFSLYGIRG
jgi:hypothetical protein